MRKEKLNWIVYALDKGKRKKMSFNILARTQKTLRN
jgi:hypothetical protein